MQIFLWESLLGVSAQSGLLRTARVASLRALCSPCTLCAGAQRTNHRARPRFEGGRSRTTKIAIAHTVTRGKVSELAGEKD